MISGAGILAAVLLMQAAPPGPTTGALPSCFGGEPFAAPAERLQELRTSHASDWDDACAHVASARQARLTQIAAELQAPPHSDTGAASRMIAAGLASSDRQDADLLLAAAEDQLLRAAWSAPPPGRPLTPLEEELYRAAIAGEIVRQDTENRARLTAYLEAKGWPESPGGEGLLDLAAWLITQHADADRAFQRRVLDLLEPLAVERRTHPHRYSLLYDRWAAGVGAPQRFGWQGGCQGAEYVPAPAINALEAAAWRDRLGLAPWAEWLASRSAACAAVAQP